jgi:hypothetical protein
MNRPNGPTAPAFLDAWSEHQTWGDVRPRRGRPSFSAGDERGRHFEELARALERSPGFPDLDRRSTCTMI